MRLIAWLSHIVVMSSGTTPPHLVLDNLPVDYTNPYGRLMRTRALLVPAATLTYSKPDRARETLRFDTDEPLGAIGSQSFSDFVRGLTIGERNDRFKGFVTGEIEFHGNLPPLVRSALDGSIHHELKDGLAVVRCTEINFQKRLGYFMGNAMETVPPWWT